MPDEVLASEPIRSLTERHRSAFSALQKHLDVISRPEARLLQQRQTGHLRSDFESENSSDDDPDWIVAHQELSRLEDEVEAAAMEMTTAPLTSIPEVIALLRYIEEFNRIRKSGYSLWPDLDHDSEASWAFAILANVRRNIMVID